LIRFIVYAAIFLLLFHIYFHAACFHRHIVFAFDTLLPLDDAFRYRFMFHAFAAIQDLFVSSLLMPFHIVFRYFAERLLFVY